jgi:hypothetical protein
MDSAAAIFGQDIAAGLEWLMMERADCAYGIPELFHLMLVNLDLATYKHQF